MDVTWHGPENCHPEIVTEALWPFANGPHVGASGRLWPQKSSGPELRCRYTLSCAHGTSRSDVTVTGTEKRPEPRSMNDWMPIGVIGMTLPGAGDGVEIVNAALGSVGEPHPAVSAKATTATTASRRATGIRFDYRIAVRSAP